jgi:hypothetical protein
MSEGAGKIIGRDVDHLVEGGIYSVLANQDGRGDFVLAKVVHLSAPVVHVVIFPPSFKLRPTAADLGEAAISFPSAINEARARHLALARKLFALMRPVFIRQEALAESDLAGYRQWMLLPEKEIVEAPTYIKPEANPDAYLRIFLFCGLPFGLLQGVYHYWRDGLVAGVCAFLFGFAIFGAGMVFTQHLAVNRRARSQYSPDKTTAAKGRTELTSTAPADALSADKPDASDALRAAAAAAPNAFSASDADVGSSGATARSESSAADTRPSAASASAFQVAEVVIYKGFGDTFGLCQEAIRTIKNCQVLEEDFSGGTLEGKVGFSLTSEGEHIVLTTYVIAPNQTGVVVASMPRAGGELDLGKNFDNVARIVAHLKMACK